MGKVAPDEPHALYRFYGAGGTLLYIGITNEIPRRLKDHSRDKPWWLGVTTITIEHYPDRVAVLEAERRAIKAEKPLYNEQHNEGGLRAIAAEPEPEHPGDTAGFWLQGYLMTAHAILDTFPPEQIERYKREARAAVAEGNERFLEMNLDAATLLGPAAITAFEDVYDLMQGLVQATQHLYRALPGHLQSAIASDLKDVDGDIRDMPRRLLEHLTDHMILDDASVAV